MAREWMINPGTCPKCGAPKHVAALGIFKKTVVKHQWGAICMECSDAGRVIRGDLNGDHALAYAIVEIRDMGPRDGTPRRRSDQQRVIWMRQGTTMSETTIRKALTGLSTLARQRETRERVPGDRWRLNASWRGGDPLPYRQGKLRRSRVSRSCHGCSADLKAGDTMWRPHNPGGTLAHAGWSSEANACALVCAACVAKLRVRAADEGSAACEPESAPSLRVVD